MNTGECRIFSIPNNGRIVLSATQTRLHFNAAVPNYGSVHYECHNNHYISGNALNICINGVWARPVPDCEPKCDIRAISSISHVTHCSRSANGVNMIVPRCGRHDLVDPGTEARIVCQDGYQSATSHEQVTLCRADGSWSRPILPCIQICGEEGPDGRPYIVGGVVTNNTKVPWHVAIYKLGNEDTETEYICGGTILSPKIVISAIHCFWDATSERVYAIDGFRIAAGKFYSRFNYQREKNHVQVFSIAELHYPPEYDHVEGRFTADIAVVIIDRYIEFKAHIAPICIDYNLSYDEKVVPPGSIGRLAGWGLEVSKGVASDRLKTIELPVIERRNCSRTIKQSFRQFLTGDKFCAGFKSQGIGPCEGDSGGGLVFVRDPDSPKPVFYLRGIVSVGPNYQGSCDSNEYTLFTNTAHFSDLIRRYDNANKPESIDISSTILFSTPPVIGKCSIYICNLYTSNFNFFPSAHAYFR